MSEIPARTRADAEALLDPGEQLLWFWTDPRGLWLTGRRMALIVMGLAVAAGSWAVFSLQDAELSPRDRSRFNRILAASVGTFALAAIRAAGWHGGADRLTDWFTPGSAAHTYALTQHRLLMLSRTGQHEVLLEPGEAVIQYGRFRIDRPDRRAKPLIRRIPKDEQHRLFTALQRARAIRNGHSPVPA